MSGVKTYNRDQKPVAVIKKSHVAKKATAKEGLGTVKIRAKKEAGARKYVLSSK